jgi:hypothetical protein
VIVHSKENTPTEISRRAPRSSISRVI